MTLAVAKPRVGTYSVSFSVKSTFLSVCKNGMDGMDGMKVYGAWVPYHVYVITGYLTMGKAPGRRGWGRMSGPRVEFKGRFITDTYAGGYPYSYVTLSWVSWCVRRGFAEGIEGQERCVGGFCGVCELGARSQEREDILTSPVITLNTAALLFPV